MIEPVVIDFESWAIQPRPKYPPKPVGVAIKLPRKKARYYAWGHPTKNNCTFEQAKYALELALLGDRPVVFHNAKFDLAVLEEGMGVCLPDKERVHDTMILAHLNDPYEPTFALKPLSEKHLGLPPEERDAVRDWLVENGVCKAGAKDWGASIAMAPGDLVGAYAIGDVDRTLGLYKKYALSIEERGMSAAYERERFLIPLLHENEKQGVRVDRERLLTDVREYQAAMETVEAWLRKRLKAPTLNLGADQQLADALDKAGVVTEFGMTPPSKTYPQGQRSVSKKNLRKSMFSDERVFLALGYRNRLQTCLSTFMLPWLEMSETTGRIYTSWRQLGAVTGRFSSSPNFQNIPKDWYDKPDGYAHPPFLRVRELPLIRSYILPDEGCVLLAADYGGQELRVAAHFEDGELMAAYRANPTLDAHGFVEGEIAKVTDRVFQRRVRKAGLFLSLYGGGARRLAEELDLPLAEATALRDAFRGALPGIWALDDYLKDCGRRGEGFMTLGGREYHAEPAKVVDGQVWRFEYKMLNCVIQGSSADQTKAAMLLYDQRRQHGRLVLTCHDEIVVSVPMEWALDEATILTEAMTSALPMDVPVIADCKIGTNYAEMETVACV